MISKIEDIISEIKQGRLVIIVDDENRENEGDLVMAADLVNADLINFMITHARGLVCLPLSSEIASRIELILSPKRGNSVFGTNFTLSIEAAKGISTGISAFDRATTIKVAINKSAVAQDLVSPGHIFPLISSKDGVLSRKGHTEAAVDLAYLAGFQKAGVICEIIKDDGNMARLPDLYQFAKTHNLKIGTIADLVKYRKQNSLQKLL